MIEKLPVDQFGVDADITSLAEKLNELIEAHNNHQHAYANPSFGGLLPGETSPPLEEDKT